MGKTVRYPTDRSIVKDRYGKTWTKQNGSWTRQDGKPGFRIPSGANPFGDVEGDPCEDETADTDADTSDDVDEK